VTPADLYELVRDLPEVRGGLVYCIDDERGAYWELTGIPVTVNTAADLILAGVVRRMLSMDASFSIERKDDGFTTYTKKPWHSVFKRETGPSPLHAALAAYRKVKP
jgi:hypothetical protein